MSRLIDLSDKTFGRLKVLHRSDRMGGKQPYWLCMCACGNQKEILMQKGAR